MTERIKVTQRDLIALMQSMYEGGYGGGPPNDKDLADALLAKYHIYKRQSANSPHPKADQR